MKLGLDAVIVIVSTIPATDQVRSTRIFPTVSRSSIERALLAAAESTVKKADPEKSTTGVVGELSRASALNSHSPSARPSTAPVHAF